MTQVAVRLDQEELAALDRLVHAGRYPTRAATIRAALEVQRRAETDRDIEVACARGTAGTPRIRTR